MVRGNERSVCVQYIDKALALPCCTGQLVLSSDLHSSLFFSHTFDGKFVSPFRVFLFFFFHEYARISSPSSHRECMAHNVHVRRAAFFTEK